MCKPIKVAIFEGFLIETALCFSGQKCIYYMCICKDNNYNNK